MFYSGIEAEIVRAACTTSKGGTFCNISENLISRMSKQGCNITAFARTLTS